MKAIILASLLGSAAGATVVTGTICYSSSFKLGVPIDGAFNVLQSAANIWSWSGTVSSSGTNILVDIDGDGVMDTNDPKVKVLITDWHISGGSNIFIEDSSGIRFRVNSDRSLTTPFVLPVGSDLILRYAVNGGSGSTGGGNYPITLIGRVQNL
jgi:hypothetical protein